MGGPSPHEPHEPQGPKLVVVPGARLEFRAVFVEHYAFVWRTLAHFGVPRASLDDAAQEVFAVVHRRLGDYDGHTALRSWLWGIARRVTSSMQRGEQRARRRLEVVQPPREPTFPDEELDQRRRIELAESCLAQLDDDQRDVFVLTEIEGFSAPEIAEALGIKLNTVYSRLRVAREKFQRAFARAQARQDRVNHGGT
jgi:RNA polymerase sigma-70 factor (ECF subfamily)